MNLKSYIIPLLALITQKANAQTDTTAFKYQKPLFDFDYQKPTFNKERAANNNGFLRSYILTGYREGVKPIESGFTNFERFDDPSNGTARIAMYNLSIADMMLGISVGAKIMGTVAISPKRIVLEVKDPYRYLYKPEYGDKLAWMRKNAWCFEYTMPKELVGKQVGTSAGSPMYLQMLIRDLFKVRVDREKRAMKTLVLVRTSATDKLKSKSENTGASGTYDRSGRFNNVGLAYLVNILEEFGKFPVIDETRYLGFVDIELNITNWQDLVAVRKELQRYDLGLKEEIRELDGVLVVKEIK